MDLLYGVLLVAGSLVSVGVGHWLSDRSATKQRTFDAQQAESARQFSAAEAEKARTSAAEEAKAAKRLAAYQDVLRAANEIVNRAPPYGDVVRATFLASKGTPSSADLMKTYDWMASDLGALRDARVRAWLDGSTMGVEIVERIFERCRAMLHVLRRQAWGKEGEKDFMALAHELYELRLELAGVARTECGRRAIDFPDDSYWLSDPGTESELPQTPDEA